MFREQQWEPMGHREELRSGGAMVERTWGMAEELAWPGLRSGDRE
jgi:hypothetical protein